METCGLGPKEPAQLERRDACSGRSATQRLWVDGSVRSWKPDGEQGVGKRGNGVKGTVVSI